MGGKRKKGPDPAALAAEQEEVARLTRQQYLTLYRRENTKSAGHRTAHKDRGKVPGFDPAPQGDIAKEHLDRIIARRACRSAWEDAYDDEAHSLAVNDDPDGMAQQDCLRSVQHDVSDALYHVTAEIEGVTGKADLELEDSEPDRLQEAADATAGEGAGADPPTERQLNGFSHQLFVRPGEPVDMAETLHILYQRRRRCPLREYCANLGVQPGKLTALSVALACRYLPANPTKTYIEVVTLVLFTCDALALDRLLGLVPADADLATYTPRSPDIAQLLTDAIRDRNLAVMDEWINFIAILASCSGPLPPDKRGRTLYCGVRNPDAHLASVAKMSKQDDVQYWPVFAPCSLDLEVAAKASPPLVFILRGVTAGIDLTNASRTPDNSELVISPFAIMRVKAKIDHRKIELEQIGSILDGDLSGVPTEQREEWATFMYDVRDQSRGMFSEGRVLQQYMHACRRASRHRATLQQLAQLIAQAESEAEAALAAADKAAPSGRAPPGAKGAAAAPKPEDMQALLDTQKVVVLDQHAASSRREQLALERQLTAINAAITANREALATKQENLPAVNELRALIRLQTELYNGMRAWTFVSWVGLGLGRGGGGVVNDVVNAGTAEQPLRCCTNLKQRSTARFHRGCRTCVLWYARPSTATARHLFVHCTTTTKKTVTRTTQETKGGKKKSSKKK